MNILMYKLNQLMVTCSYMRFHWPVRMTILFFFDAMYKDIVMK